MDKALQYICFFFPLLLPPYDCTSSSETSSLQKCKPICSCNIHLWLVWRVGLFVSKACSFGQEHSSSGVVLVVTSTWISWSTYEEQYVTSCASWWLRCWCTREELAELAVSSVGFCFISQIEPCQKRYITFRWQCLDMHDPLARSHLGSKKIAMYKQGGWGML